MMCSKTLYAKMIINSHICAFNSLSSVLRVNHRFNDIKIHNLINPKFLKPEQKLTSLLNNQ